MVVSLDQDRAKLFLQSHLHLPVEKVLESLRAIDDFYSAIVRLENTIINNTKGGKRDLERLRMISKRAPNQFIRTRSLNDNFALHMDEKLIVVEAKFNSPGFWAFIGKLNPLEVVRNLINDYREHKKDSEYRNSYEARRLELENSLLENKVLKERIGMLKEIGLTPVELSRIRESLVGREATRLLSVVDEGIIRHAEIAPLTRKIVIDTKMDFEKK